MNKFEVGEVCIVCPSDPWVEDMVGAECVVVMVGTTDNNGHPRDYRVHIPGFPCTASKDGTWSAMECDLRKKKPPRENKDITNTVGKDAPSFNEMMKDLKHGKASEVIDTESIT